MKYLVFYGVIIILSSCALNGKYDPSHKFPPEQLQKDYDLFRNILEESHPSLYWYTPKDSMDYYFEWGANQLKDSLPEYKFRLVLSYVLARIRCGHTTVKASVAAMKYSERTRSFAFPLNLKLWADTTIVTSTLNRKDSLVNHGVILNSIDNHPLALIVDSLSKFLSADGFNTTHKYQTLSNPGVFRNLYGAVYGLKPKIKIDYVDTLGNNKSAFIQIYNPTYDSLAIRFPSVSFSRKERKQMIRESARNLRIDTALNTGFMELNTFAKGNSLRKFFRTSFRELHKRHIARLVIDIRSNGGGSVVLSDLLTRYIADKPFKIADSLYASVRKSRYARYEQNYIINRMFLMFMTHKRRDGHYHFAYFENNYLKPRLKNHFNGKIYIITGGNTFSAAALFAKSLKDQSNVTTVGEETGGGAYGNTAWLIPDITLPNTGIRFRLPLFRLVIDRNEQKGRGVIPKVPASPKTEDIRRNHDFKMNKVLDLIRNDER